MNKDNFPLVSCIVTTFNRSDYLEECIKSIQFQTYKNIEIIIVDDGSCQTSVFQNKLICNQFSKCKYYYKNNSGQPASRNYGIKRAKGEYIAFCDDDDFWVLDKLEIQVKILEQNRRFGLATGSIEYVRSNSEKTGKTKSHKGHNHGYIFNDLLVKNRTASIIPLIKKEVFDKVGYFNTNYTIAEDWEFWRRVSYYYKFYFINEVLAYVRLHDKNMSLSRKGTVLERYKLYRKLTKSLLKWGVGKFNKKEKKYIEYIEWCHYRKLFSNNLRGFYKKIFFLITIFKDISHLINLYITYNNNYKIQK